jgi:hypothetical protein
MKNLKPLLYFILACCVIVAVNAQAGPLISDLSDLPVESPYSSPVDKSIPVPSSNGILEFKMSLSPPEPQSVIKQACQNVTCNCEVQTFSAILTVHIEGRDGLEGYMRDLDLPVLCEIHNGSINPEDPAQTIDTEMVSLSLASPLFGDPDFESLTIIGGTSNGMPSPGKTEITKLPSGDFAVDSFFDITYQIEFEGAPGSPLEGVVGGGGGPLTMSTPDDVAPHFLLASEDDWQRALASGEIQSMSEAEGTAYLLKFNEDLKEGEPYPQTIFLQPELFVLGEDNIHCEEPGLVMEWGDDSKPDGDYAAAWKYIYPADPDLTNTTITVTTDPPCGMQQVSIGMQDQNGNIRAWYWNVAPAGAVGPFPPGTIACSPLPPTGPITTNISINTNILGVNAATPVAAAYTSTAGGTPATTFDITTVISFTFDENNTFVATIQSPSPGSGQIANWNYWHNLLVSPNAGGGGGGTGGSGVNSKWFTKYSQPPEEIAPGVINGWDEKSDYKNRPIMADDWECKDKRPVTDIHWWGSFIGWTQPYPPQLPDAFHIAIWTDVPDPDPTDPANWSHPGTLVWENYCDTFIWNYAGYDLDPRTNDPDHQEDETCFQFAQFLSQDEWFHQEPMEDGTPNVYWLSIAAVYNNADTVQHPWGWKTRPHFFNDDAVRIQLTQDTTGADNWPPTIGSTTTMNDCQPIEFPAGVSWDLAFELTTNEPGYEDDPIPGDVGGATGLGPDGEVNLFDLAIVGRHWLERNIVVAP